MIELQLPADVDVFGDHVGAPVADAIQRTAAKRSDDPGHGKHPAVDPLGALDQADDRRELTDLDAPDQGRARSNTRVASHRAHPWIVDQRRHQIGRSILIQQGIAVDAHQVLAARRQCAHAQGHRLALVLRQVQHTQARLTGGQLVEHRTGVIARAVVDGDHFKRRIALRQGRANGFQRVLALVETGHQNRDQRRPGQLRRQYITVIGPGPVALPVQPEIAATGDPQRRHEQRVEKYEIQQHIPGQAQRHANRCAKHQQQNQQGIDTVNHGNGYQALENAGRMLCTRGWSLMKSSG